MPQSLDIAILTENFPPCAGGGIAEWALGVAENLAQMGHVVTVLSKWNKTVDVQVHQHKPFRLRRMAGRDWRRYRYWYGMYYLWSFLRQHPEGVAIATTWELAHSFVRLRKRFPRVRLIVVGHGVEITRVEGGRRLQHFQKTMAAAHLVVAVSRFTREAIVERLAAQKSEHVVFIPNGVDVRRFHRVENSRHVARQLGIPDHGKIILTLARVIERKGHDTVIRCLPELFDEFPETYYVIAGPWKEPHYQKLQNLIAEHRLNRRVIFTGFVSEDMLPLYYSMSDVYVMVSRTIESKGDSEGFGITFLEANACGRPVIGSTAGGIGDAVEDGVSGFLVPPDDVAALREKILLLFRNPGLAQRLGEQGRRRVQQNFTWDRITEQMMAAFNGRLQQSA
jgi:phosphatidylinositol alpha-1,6-mannosyltransferase